MSLIKNGNWIDPKGRDIPRDVIPMDTRKEDRLAERVYKRTLKLQERIAKEKKTIESMILDHLTATAEKYGEEWKGNATIRDYSNTVKITVNISERITFGPKLQIAKQKIDALLVKWSADANPNIRAIMTDAFDTDNPGKVNAHKILRLRNLKIKDKEWQEAMDLIDESLTVTGSKRYIRIDAKPERDQAVDFEPLSLNWSKL